MIPSVRPDVRHLEVLDEYESQGVSDGDDEVCEQLVMLPVGPVEVVPHASGEAGRDPFGGAGDFRLGEGGGEDGCAECGLGGKGGGA